MRRIRGKAFSQLASRQKTLASDYVINISENSWIAHRIQDTATDPNAPEGEMAVESLNVEPLSVVEPSFTLSVTIHNNDRLAIEQTQLGPQTSPVDGTLVAILSRVMAQWIIEQQGMTSQSFAIQLPNEEFTSKYLNVQNDTQVLELFQPLLGSIENIELSEMVDQDGKCLGIVPRKLVHMVNLLHRGVGLVVTKDKPIHQPYGGTDDTTNAFPDLYVHRRTDCKRIFPSLYDMFVGGISTARESAKMTAAREVAEELGLVRSLDLDPTVAASNDMPPILSDPLFECIVCTSYNRCVVTVFCCTFDSTRDEIQWQGEEVAWGAFVPYHVIEASADLSIQRLIDSNSWPGKIPVGMTRRVHLAQARVDSASKIWEYVPDGLLVWEAWLQWQNS